MTSLPPVPAVNRWTKLYPSLAWHAATLNMHGMLKDIWGIVFCYDGNRTSEDDPSGLVQDLLLLEDDDIHAR